MAGGQRTDYPAGSTIYREGAAPRAVLVIQGLLRVFMTSPDGRQVTVRYTREADVLGIAVIVGGPVNVAVQTVTESSLFSVDARMLTEAGRRDARVGWALAEELNRRLYDTLQQTAINTFGSVRQRVAAALLDLASAQRRPKDRLVAHVSQQELADAVGSVREVVTGAARVALVAGVAAALISVLQFVLGAVLAGTTTPGTAHLLYDAVNRLDGAKMLALAILALASAASGVLPRWLRYTAIALAIAIAASSVAYLLLLPSLAVLAIPAGVLLLVFITATGITLVGQQQAPVAHHRLAIATRWRLPPDSSSG